MKLKLQLQQHRAIAPTCATEGAGNHPVSVPEKMQALYLASSNLMAYLGRNGVIQSDGHAADTLMNCLNELDGGEFNDSLFNISTDLAAAPPAQTPTTGMNIAQRILHVGGRNNAAGYVEFGSIQAVEALVRQVLRDFLAPPAQTPPPPAHPDDAAVDRFAEEMKAKMAASREKGRGGWEDRGACTETGLQRMLQDHLIKGDPVDVGNFAMMLFNRGERTA